MFRFWIPAIAVSLFVGCSSESANLELPTNDEPIGQTKSVEEPAVVVPVDAKAAKAAYAELDAAFQAAVKDLRELVSKTDDKNEQARLLATKNPVPEFSQKYMSLAKNYPGTQASVDATLFVVGQSRGAQKHEAMTYLIENYSDKVKLTNIADSFIKEIPSPDIDAWFHLMIDHASSDPIKARVMLTFAKYIDQLPFFRRTLEMNPQIANRLPQPQRDYINTPRTEEQNKELAAILQSLIDDFGDLKYKGRQTYAEAATSELFELNNLQVGLEAPDISGKDLDDIPFKLSHYRGKVVMLDFWGHWCPPCRAMYDHEQEIARKLADKPFVLLGVNSDADLDDARKAVQSRSLSWRHFWNGPKGTRGPISTEWNIEGSGWPTVYLIDQDGVIRYKEVLGKDIDRGIETLMAEMGHDVKLSDDAE